MCKYACIFTQKANINIKQHSKIHFLKKDLLTNLVV